MFLAEHQLLIGVSNADESLGIPLIRRSNIVWVRLDRQLRRRPGRACRTFKLDVRRFVEVARMGYSLRVGMARRLVASHLTGRPSCRRGPLDDRYMVAHYTQKISARRGAIAKFYGKRAA